MFSFKMIMGLFVIAKDVKKILTILILLSGQIRADKYLPEFQLTILKKIVLSNALY